MKPTEIRFGFGKNWEKFIKGNFSEERVDIALKHILNFLEIENLKGKYFLDIGCGSGLHSLAAYRGGASMIVSFDYDMSSVKTTEKLRAFAGNPNIWEICQGSILDVNFLQKIKPADIVYSWGVLHHTGNMWEAMNNAGHLMKNNGLLYIALYDYEIQVNPTPEFWLDLKQDYNRSGWIGQRKWEIWYFWNYVLSRNMSNILPFLKRLGNYKYSRGMAFYTDIVDWLGGWPMEFAKRPDVKKWAARNNLEMLKMKTGEANTEYLFKKK